MGRGAGRRSAVAAGGKGYVGGEGRNVEVYCTLNIGAVCVTYYIIGITRGALVTQSTFTFRVDDDLKIAFAEAAKAQDRTAAQLLRVLMREAVQRQRDGQEHDAWFRAQVEQGIREADDPSVRRIPHETVQANWRRQRAEFVKRTRGKTGRKKA
jgi:predicted transcriptional regulator